MLERPADNIPSVVPGASAPPAPPAAAERIIAGANAKNVVAAWDHAHRYTPAPRHRRRLILQWLSGLRFADCLDAGCAQPYLLHEIVRRFGVQGYGCDISDQVVAGNDADPLGCRFAEVDLTKGGWPGGRRFDLVVSSEVLEHIPDWPRALDNLVAMTGRYLLLTVPSGPIRLMDRMVGHHQHFDGPELAAAVRERGLEILRQRKWGFPMHSLYKAAISKLSPDRLYQSFSGGGEYSAAQKLVSHALWLSFFANAPFDRGAQYLLLAERPA
jgi:hypothetical protein